MKARLHGIGHHCCLMLKQWRFFIPAILGTILCFLADLRAEEISFFEEQKQLNQALEATLQSPPFLGLFGQARWNARLGDLYFSLNAYPQARLFYERALFFAPENAKIVKNLEETLHRLGLEAASSSWRKQLAMEWLLPQADRWSLFFLTALLAIVCRKISRFAKYLDGIAAGFLLLALFGHFIRPVEVILLRPALLQPFPISSGTYLSHEPLLAGTKAELLQVVGDFAKLRLENEVGFLPTKHIHHASPY